MIILVPSGHRLCSRCGDIHPVDDFQGAGTLCSACKSYKTQIRGAEKRMSVDIASLRVTAKDKIIKLRRCGCCNTDRKPTEFMSYNTIICVYCKTEMAAVEKAKQFAKDDANYRLYVAKQEEAKESSAAQAAREREYAERRAGVPIITEEQERDIQAMIDDINKPKRKDYSGR